MHIFLIVLSIIALYPLFIEFTGSFKFPHDLAANPAGLPQVWTLSNYRRLGSYNGGIIIRTYFNSLFVTVCHVSILLLFSTMAAFAFSKYRFKGRNVIFLALLATMMIPSELLITPLFVLFAKINWLNTYQVQIFPFTANVFSLFMLRQYMSSVPDSVLDAARIDGAGHLKVYWSIMIPLCSPVIGALTILNGLHKFNDYMWPKIMVTKLYLQPIMVVLPTLNEENNIWSIPRELVLTGCAIVTIPLIILFICFQSKFMSSVTLGAVKE